MYINTYRIRRAFLVPFGLAVFLLFLLTILAFVVSGTGGERIVLASLFFFNMALFAELISRKIATGDKGIMIRKLFRRKELSWEDITHVGGLVIKNKAYLLLTTVRGFHIISSSYGNFHTLVSHIKAHVAGDKIEEQVKEQTVRLRQPVLPIITAWAAVLLIAGLIYIKFQNF